MPAAAVAGVVAVLCALLLPFAPVWVNEPTVSWPRDPHRPESTLLTLTAYRPLQMNVQFSCAIARRAQTAGGVVLATVRPQLPDSGELGLVVQAADDRLQVRALDRVLLDEPLGDRPCNYALTGRSGGLPSFVRSSSNRADPAATPDPSAVAGPDNAELVVTRDGAELVRAQAEQLPGVDLLTSSVTGPLQDDAGELSVTLRIDDEFTSSPTPLKSAITTLLVVALLATALLLILVDRGVARAPRRGTAEPRVMDVVVPAVILGWMFIAPATDDDGYFATMARNAALSGEVGNYYQFHNQSFTPFTWVYQALAWWQQFVGLAPVVQRVPAAVCGVLTWLVLRWFAHAAIGEFAPDRPRVASLAHAALGVVFVAWWVPYDMGVRPEPVVALCGAAAMLAVLVAHRRRRLVAAWLAFALAGLGFTAHTAGFTALAPLLAGLPLLLGLIHVPGDHRGTALRAIAVTSGGMVAPLVAFADGALRDFLRGQAIFLSMVPQQGWVDEFERYIRLLNQVPMGNYAKRAAVLLCLVALVWFAVLTVAARVRRFALPSPLWRIRRVALPTPLWLSGSTTALAFLALWATPSKWTHHFGALAGVGSAFLGLLLVMAVPLARQVLQGAHPPIGLLIASIGSAIAAIALGWHGPNQWAYAWLDGIRRPDRPPAVLNVDLDQPLLWLLVVALVTGGLAARSQLTGNRNVRLDVLRAVPIVVVLSLIGTIVYTVGTFGSAALRGVPSESVWARGLEDPTGERCGAAGVIQVLDPTTARPLPPAIGLPAPPRSEAFVAGGGYYPGHRPQGPGAAEVWGSLGRDGNSATGQMTTAWYRLPSRLDGEAAVTVLAAGTLSRGNALTAVYGTSSGDAVVTLGTEALSDTARSPSWRTLRLNPPPATDLVRLRAVDASVGLHGWLAFAAPSVQRPVVLNELLPAEAPVALGWKLAFNYPCQRQPRILHGITEPPRYAVLQGDETLSGLTEFDWQPLFGGAFGNVGRTQSVQQLLTVPSVDPHVQVYALAAPFKQDAYTITIRRRFEAGASTATR
jgi:hypothetical protein